MGAWWRVRSLHCGEWSGVELGQRLWRNSLPGTCQVALSHADGADHDSPTLNKHARHDTSTFMHFSVAIVVNLLIKGPVQRPSPASDCAEAKLLDYSPLGLE